MDGESVATHGPVAGVAADSAPVAGDEADSAPVAGDDAPASPSPRRRDTLRRAARACTSHPLVVTGVLVSLVAIGHGWWIWENRHLGGFDPDETSYLSSALRIHRSIDLAHPFAVVRAMLANGHGVAVPTLSVPLLILGPRDPRTAMLIQPILLVFISVAVAAMTRRITGPVAAIVAGVWVALLPTVTTAVQSYWYGLGAAAAMAGAMWALLASDRGRNRRIWLYGVGIGVMLMSRTMTLGYLPAIGLAGLVVAYPDRRALRRVVGAGALGVAIALPWYLLNRGAIFGYLFSFGYGDNAALFGETGLGDRLSLRWDRMKWGMSLGDQPILLPFALAMCAIVLFRSVRRRPTGDLDARAWLAVVGAVALGSAALVSTANNGVWFELPMVVLAVPVLVGAVAQAPRPLAVFSAVVVLAAGLVPLPGALGFREWAPDDPTRHYEWGFSEYDERFHPSRRAEHPQAAADWWALAQDVERALKRISPDGRSAVFITTGNTHLYNANTVRMAAELDPWDPHLWVPDTTRAPAVRAEDLTPTVDIGQAEPSERVLVVGIHDQILWPLDAEVRSFLAQARRAGFVETERFEMPRGGDVVIFRHPKGRPA